MAEVEEIVAEPARRGPGVMTLVKAIAFVSVIVILEVAAATVFLPSAEATRKMGEEFVAASGSPPAEGAGESADGDKTEGEGHVAQTTSKEMSLGTFHVVSFNPSTGASLSIDFELFGVVLAEEETDFSERFVLHERRLNEQVTIAVRGMESADFNDPGLGLIKRVILEKVNRALGKSLVREAVFSGFSYNERPR